MSERRSGVFTVFLVVASLALAVLVVLLARQNLMLKRQIASMTADPLAGAIAAGERFGALTLVEPSGERRPLEFDPAAGPTLLLVFTARCPACRETIPIWNAELAALQGDRPRVIGVQLDASPEGAGTVGAFPVFGVDRAASAALEKIPGVPATVLLDASGVVERIWFGVLDAEQRTELKGWITASSRG